MAGRYELLESDEGRLPEGMQRVGYDADAEIYTYQDEGGNYWQGAPGSRFSGLRRTGTRGPRNRNPAADEAALARHKAEDWRYMAPFFLLVILVLLAVWHFFGPTIIFRCPDGQQAYRVLSGDTCWAIADSRGTTVDELTKINKGLSCDKLRPGMQICTP